MVGQSVIQEARRRQDEKMAEVEKLRVDFLSKRNEWAGNARKCPPDLQAVFKGLIPEDAFRTGAGITDALIRLRESDPERWKEVSAKAASITKEIGGPTIQEVDEAERALYKAEWEFFRMIEEDRKGLFTKEYTDRLLELADHGWFFLGQMTPDFESFLGPSWEANVKEIVSRFSENGYHILFYETKEPTAATDDPDAATRRRAADLRDALLCLANGAYPSCARTMFALIERQYENASGIFADCFAPGVSRGSDKAGRISEMIGKSGCEYDKECWDKYDAYYRKWTTGSDKKGKGMLNRNELAHGDYGAGDTTPEDCLQLMFFYLSFTQISYRLQEEISLSNKLSDDLKIYVSSKEAQ